ncbi:MAG TPA: helix-turn-helix transcriptional regulator [Candidatus Faecalibacterium intestinipullorum]|nr:helix-turn-helix transcriptional regulator [Candidatus Faecalibacterium intestinipullorum]
MNLEEGCALAQEITRVPITRLETAPQRADFCSAHQFHPAQDYLLPQALELLLAELAPGEILSTLDLFRVRFLFCKIQDVPLAVGPFCTEFFSQNDCEILLRRAGLPGVPPRELTAYRGQIVVCSEGTPLHTARSLARAVGGPPLSELRARQWETPPAQPRDLETRTLSGDLVQRRYQIEQALMDAIQEGDAPRAVERWQELHHSVAFIKQLGQTMETARIAAAITRTAIRLAAAQAGLDPLTNDQISGQSSALVRAARTVEEIDREHERLIREYCRAIRIKRDSGYSSLVLSAIYQLERHCAQPITVAGLARELEVSPGYLTAQFKKEVGVPPLSYLNRVRMRQAARQLARTNAPVQEVAASVGILDANYFVKRFKAAFGYTPTEFRRRYGI